MKLIYFLLILLQNFVISDNEFPVVYIAGDFNAIQFELTNERIGVEYWGSIFKGVSQQIPVMYETYLDKSFNIHQKACQMFSQLLGKNMIFFGKEGETGYKFTAENLKRGPIDYDVKKPLEDFLRKYEYLAGPSIVQEGVFWKQNPMKIHIIARDTGVLVARWFQYLLSIEFFTRYFPGTAIKQDFVASIISIGGIHNGLTLPYVLGVSEKTGKVSGEETLKVSQRFADIQYAGNKITSHILETNRNTRFKVLKASQNNFDKTSGYIPKVLRNKLLFGNIKSSPHTTFTQLSNHFKAKLKMSVEHKIFERLMEELSIHFARDFNEIVPTFDTTYYISYAFKASMASVKARMDCGKGTPDKPIICDFTKIPYCGPDRQINKFEDVIAVTSNPPPDNLMINIEFLNELTKSKCPNLNLIMSSFLIGSYFVKDVDLKKMMNENIHTDENWQDNDGFVNLISQRFPKIGGQPWGKWSAELIEETNVSVTLNSGKWHHFEFDECFNDAVEKECKMMSFNEGVKIAKILWKLNYDGRKRKA